MLSIRTIGKVLLVLLIGEAHYLELDIELGEWVLYSQESGTTQAHTLKQRATIPCSSMVSPSAVRVFSQ